MAPKQQPASFREKVVLSVVWECDACNEIQIDDMSGETDTKALTRECVAIEPETGEHCGWPMHISDESYHLAPASPARNTVQVVPPCTPPRSLIPAAATPDTSQQRADKAVPFTETPEFRIRLTEWAADSNTPKRARFATESVGNAHSDDESDGEWLNRNPDAVRQMEMRCAGDPNFDYIGYLRYLRGMYSQFGDTLADTQLDSSPEAASPGQPALDSVLDGSQLDSSPEAPRGSMLHGLIRHVEPSSGPDSVPFDPIDLDGVGDNARFLVQTPDSVDRDKLDTQLVYLRGIDSQFGQTLADTQLDTQPALDSVLNGSQFSQQ